MSESTICLHLNCLNRNCLNRNFRIKEFQNMAAPPQGPLRENLRGQNQEAGYPELVSGSLVPS